MIVRCKDCGQMGNEDPDDPAPCLCPECYDKRLAKVSLLLPDVLEKVNDPALACLWLALALEEVAGETPEFARKHANEVLNDLILSLTPN